MDEDVDEAADVDVEVEVIHDAFYHLRLAVITSNMSIKIAYAS